MTAQTRWPCAALREAELADRTTLRVGGRAAWLLEPADPEELRAAYVAAREAGGPVRILGGGANLLIDDGVLPGVVISTARLRRSFRLGDREPGADPFVREEPQQVTRDQETGEPRLVAWCGATMPGLVRAAGELGWTGLEGLVGVPGSLGGGVAMNAGGRWGEMWDVVESVRCLSPDGVLFDLPRAECTPRYRNGGLGENLVVGAVLRLQRDHKAAVRERMRTYLGEKKAAQPVTEASSGCVFKNPDPELTDGRSAGQLVEAAGAKGMRRGDAMVSELHGNFIVNRGRATAVDVFALIEDVQAAVAERFGLTLDLEVKAWRSAED